MFASFFSRFIALIIDAILISIVQGVILSLFGFDWGRIGDYSDGYQNMMYQSLGVGSLLTILYFALFESSEMQATPGKMAMGIKVTDYYGNRISIGKAVVRTLSKYLSQLILCIGYIMAAFTEKNQALHDYIATTYVVKKGHYQDSFADGEMD